MIPGASATPGAPAAGRDTAVVVCVTLLCLLPFVGKAIHIDDPMYLWAAQRIQLNPLDFYGLDVNWHGFTDSMAWSNKNPPLVSFYLAIVAGLLGWSEIALHLGMLVPALGLALGALALGRRLSTLPLVAALAVLATPAVLVSSTSLMAEVSLAALWCWAVVLWLDAVERESAGRLVAAGALAGAAVLTKFVAVALVPLLAAYTVARQRERGRSGWRWAAALSIPLAVAALYQATVLAWYGEGAPTAAASYALLARERLGAAALEKSVVALAFLGGGLLSALCFLPQLASRRALGLGVAGLLAGCLLLAVWPGAAGIGAATLRGPGGVAWALLFQLVLFAATGAGILALAAADLRRNRDAASLLLALWVGGLFVFAAFLNWSTNVRSILPAAPAVGVLIARGLAHAGATGPARFAPLAPALLLALAVTAADFRLAASARDAAADLCGRYGNRPGVLWFQGAWGFQWYMEAAGARRTDLRGSTLAAGELMIVPESNSNLWRPPAGSVRLVEEARYPAGRWLATLGRRAGAGFHSDVWGPLPFALGRVPDERYRVFELQRELKLPEAVLGSDPAPKRAAR